MQGMVCSNRPKLDIDSLRLFHPDKSAPADFRSRYRESWPLRITHAVLAKLDKFRQSASLRQLEDLTQLDHRTLNAALAELKKMKLAVKERNRWPALVPPVGLFRTRNIEEDQGEDKKKSPHWSEPYAYLGLRVLPKARIGTRRFTLRQAATYWAVISFSRGGESLDITNKRLRGFLGCDDQTVESHLELLKEANLIEFSRQSSGYAYEIRSLDHTTRSDLFMIPAAKPKARPKPETPAIDVKLAAESIEDKLERDRKAIASDKPRKWKTQATAEMPEWERALRVQLVQAMLPASMIEERIREARKKHRNAA